MSATRCELSDRDLVAAVRSGDDSAFEELFRRYQRPIAAYVGRMVHDPARAEDLAQDAFFSALRRLRETDADVAFKPWIYEIARNAAIDHWRRTSRAEEVSVDHDERLRPSDRARLVGSAAPDSAVVNKERLNHLQGAFEELGDVHARALVMRELEGMSYREIAEQLDVTRSTVESTLLQARQRLEVEYETISDGRRCDSVRAAIGRLAEGLESPRDEARVARHARRCPGCLLHARQLGVEPLSPATRLRRKIAGLLPLPLLEPAAERAAAVVAAIVIAGAGGAVLSGVDVSPGGERSGSTPAGLERQATPAPPSGVRGSSDERGARSDSRGAGRGDERGSRRRERGGGGSGDAVAPRDRARGGGSPTPGGSPTQGGSPGSGSPGTGSPGTGSPGTSGGRGGGLPGTPDLPNLPSTPSLPDTPDLPGGQPSLPSAPQLPSAPTVETPSLPQTPSLPETPSLPQAPAVEPPSTPSIDSGAVTDALPPG